MTSCSITTLLVESDARRASHLKGLLSGAAPVSVSVETAATLAEGLRLISEGSFQVALLRLRLPDARGLEALVRFREANPHTPLIALLEDEEKNIILDAAQSLSDDCLFYGDLDTESLTRALALAIDRREMLRELRSKQTESAQSVSPFQSLLNHFDEALFLVRREDGKAIFVNEVARSWFGDRISEALADAIDYGALQGDDIEVAISTGYDRIPHAELRSVALDWKGTPCCLVSFRNISKRKRAEEAFLASQRRLELALKASNIGLWSWDLRGHQLQYSDRWKAQLGYKAHEFPNTLSAFRRVLHPDDKDKALSDFRSILKGIKRDFECEFRLRHKSGEFRVILCRAEVFPDADGKLAMVLGTHIDITERSREAARESPVSSGQSEAMSRLTEILSDRFEAVAGELEEIANEVRSFFRSDSSIAARIQEMERLSRRVSALNSLLRVELDTGDREPTRALELATLVNELGESLGQLLPNKATLRVHVDESVPFEGLEARYVSLLLAESLALVSPKVQTMVKSHVDLRGFRLGRSADAEPTSCIEISYQGKPIDESAIAALPLCQGVTAESFVSNGLARMRLWLPSETAPRSDSQASVDTGPRLALLAEDEGVLRFAIRSMLESLDYEVKLAEDGAAAIDLFFERPMDYAVALVDLHMPVIDGYSVVKSIRAHRPDLSIVKMSGDDADSIGETFGLDDPRCCFLSKPFGASELKAAIASMSLNVTAT